MSSSEHPANLSQPDSGRPTPGRSMVRTVYQQITRARRFVTNLLFVLIMLVLLVGLIGSCQRTSRPQASALLLNPTGDIVERTSIAPGIADLLDAEFALRETAMPDLLDAIQLASADEAITEIVIDLGGLASLSQGQAVRLGKALLAFREQDKRVSIYSYSFEQNGYLLASYANAVYLHPAGQALFPGIGLYTLFVKDLLDRLRIDLNVFRVGELKSATETFTRNTMSEAVKAEYQDIANRLWADWQQTVADNRGLELSTVSRYTDNFAEALQQTGGDTARIALETELIDELLTTDEFTARVSEKHGSDGEGGFQGIDFRRYLEFARKPRSDGGRYVAMLALEGSIVMDAPQGNAIGAEQTVAMVRRLRQDRNCAGLVLRVNSPGGSSFASELIRKELELFQLSGRPLVVSMADTAASGGYWIAATADRIFAEPTTITGSIGVFAIVPTFNRALNEFGITGDGVGTTPLAGAMSPVLGINDSFRSVLNQSLQHTYREFTALVARGRELPLDSVEALATGRILLGAQAREAGLVDVVGGVDVALAEVLAQVDLEPESVRRVQPGAASQIELLRELMLGRSDWRGVIGTALMTTQQLQKNGSVPALLLQTLDDPTHSYALCELCSPSTFR